jgi:hypothetical protein
MLESTRRANGSGKGQPYARSGIRVRDHPGDHGPAAAVARGKDGSTTAPPEILWLTASAGQTKVFAAPGRGSRRRIDLGRQRDAGDQAPARALALAEASAILFVSLRAGFGIVASTAGAAPAVGRPRNGAQQVISPSGRWFLCDCVSLCLIPDSPDELNVTCRYRPILLLES